MSKFVAQGNAARKKIHVGCAGWSIPKAEASHFPASGSHLDRYASVFDTVEINSSFYRPHQAKTYARWAAAVAEDFVFAVKVPRTITHMARLHDTTDLLRTFLGPVRELGAKLGPLLVQTPPSLACKRDTAAAFFETLREQFTGLVAFEPRHRSWFTDEAGRLLQDYRIARVLADPCPVDPTLRTELPGFTYVRLHGSPEIYYSSYDEATLDAVATRLTRAVDDAPSWCIFDNTAAGAAYANARELRRRLGDEPLNAPFRAPAESSGRAPNELGSSAAQPKSAF
jgi:uncharacterized protein YecE (DUF72 family)